MTDIHIGKTIYAAAAVPATNDTTGFEALSWTLVKGPQQLPQLGVTHATIQVDDVATGWGEKQKGLATGVSTSMAFRDVASDAGQTIMEAQALDKKGPISIKIVKGSGTDLGDGPAPQTGDAVEYAQGIVHSFQPNQGDGSTFEGFTVTFEQNKPTVAGTEPA